MNGADPSTPGVKATLGLFDATAISIGAIIGAGIFVVIGIAAGLAGPAVILSILIAAGVSQVRKLLPGFSRRLRQQRAARRIDRKSAAPAASGFRRLVSEFNARETPVAIK